MGNIIQLTAELIVEYVADGYDAHDLAPGDWGDDDWQKRRDVLRSALERLKQR